MSSAVEALLLEDWDFSDQSGGGGDYPYPCRFPGQLPARLIERLSAPGDLVLDPFLGSGTTVVEALRHGRRAAGLDANPLAVVLTRAKSRPATAEDELRLRAVSARATALVGACRTVGCQALSEAPEIPNRAKWFADAHYHELAHLRLLLNEVSGAARDLGDLAICQAAARVSFQDSETRYVSVPRATKPGEALVAFTSEVARLLKVLPCSTTDPDVLVAHGDARDRASYPVEDGTVDLIVTSPPYPNAYDYHLYHRFRLFWLGFSPAVFRSVEVGSHLRQQTVEDPVADYEADMKSVLQNLFAVLKPGGLCIFVVGDGIYGKVRYPTGDRLVALAESTGLCHVGSVHRALPTNRRSVTVAGRRLRQETIVFLARRQEPTTTPPTYPVFPYEEELARRELATLAARTNQDADALRHLAFASSYELDGACHPTWQHYLESYPPGRRKNSTYATHGLHRYKGKFYPQLAKCLMNLTAADGYVLDPFGGSGTVALEASINGRPSYSIELSPVGASIARAKVGALTVPGPLLKQASQSLRAELTKTKTKTKTDWSQFEPDTRTELESWFSPLILGRLSNILAVIRRVASESSDAADATTLRLLGEVILSDLVRDVSHQDPADLRIRRRSEPPLDAPLGDLFLAKWEAAIEKVLYAQAGQDQGMPVPATATVVQGDSRHAENWPDPKTTPISAVISSPPYASALPYIDTDRLSMAAVFGWSKQRRAGLERSLVGTRELGDKVSREWAEKLGGEDLVAVLPAPTLQFLRELLDDVTADTTAGFRRRQAPAVLCNYFVGMSAVLQQLSMTVVSGAHIWLVMGDSRMSVAGKPRAIHTTDHIGLLAEHWGLQRIEAIPITVTRENMRHAKHSITRNTLLHYQAA